MIRCSIANISHTDHQTENKVCVTASNLHELKEILGFRFALRAFTKDPFKNYVVCLRESKPLVYGLQKYLLNARKGSFLQTASCSLYSHHSNFLVLLRVSAEYHYGKKKINFSTY